MRKPQIFLIHFAGGNCYSFQFIKSLFTSFDVIPLELPGRGKRMNEDLITEFDVAAEDLYKQLLINKTDSKFIIYGHSMGAYLALKITQMLENHKHFPTCLFVSGNPGPQACTKKTIHLLPDEEFLFEINKHGGIPVEFYEHSELLDYYLPILRADFQIVEKNNKISYQIQTPIFAMMGNKEEKSDEINNWNNFTTSTFEFKLFEGSHFFIFDHPEEIAKIITTNFN